MDLLSVPFMQRLSVDSHSKGFYQIQLVMLQIHPFQIQMHCNMMLFSLQTVVPNAFMAAVIVLSIVAVLQLMTAD